MQTSKMSEILESAATKHNEEYISIVTEMLDQKLSDTEGKLTNLYQKEMNTISANFNSRLENIEKKAQSTFNRIESSAKQTNAYKWTTLFLTAMLCMLIGAGTGIWISWNKINPLTHWQIPKDMRYTQKLQDQKATEYFLKIPKQQVYIQDETAYVHIKTIKD